MLRTINVRDDIHSKMRLKAFENKISLQGLVNEVLAKYLEEDSKKA